MSFPKFTVPSGGEFLRDALGNPLPDESLLVLTHIDRLERENAALKKELAPLRETVGVRGDAVTSRDDIAYWCKLMDGADKAERLERENAALREALIITTERLSHYVRVPVPVAPGLYATSAEEKASLEVLVKAWEVLYPKAQP